MDPTDAAMEVFVRGFDDDGVPDAAADPDALALAEHAALADLRGAPYRRLNVNDKGRCFGRKRPL
jgi:hypothetical protein